MTELLTAAQMRAIEEAAIASGQVTGLELMERAGRGVVEAIFEEWPELKAGSFRAVVLCGPGNNGGDGFVVARLLKECGWEVEVFLYGDPEKMPPDARVNYERWVGMGEVGEFTLRDVAGVLFTHATTEVDFSSGSPVVIDSLFGTGLSRVVEAELLRVLGLLSDMVEFEHGAVVAVDIPSGICADSGRPLGNAASANLTVTFHHAKLGHNLTAGPAASGKLSVKDIGLARPSAFGDEARARPAGGAFAPAPGGRVGREQGMNPRQEFVCLLDDSLAMLAASKANAHKFTHGHALIVSGTHGHSGAARLAARGALRIGAGLVTVASPPDAMAENAARLDAIMLREVAGAEDLAGVLADKRINALCLGPGMGMGEGQAELLGVALGGSRGEPRPTVLDADALTILSQRPDLFGALHASCVLTPHAGEFARLFPDIAEKLAAPATKGPAYSKVDATREAAARAGCVVLYKGPDTVIADPTGRAAINAAVYDRAAPWLATAGSGDVLAGFITGLLARGFSPFDAACTGAWLHVECARSFGAGLIAEDLPEELPKVLRALGL